MLALISPAKKLEFAVDRLPVRTTSPQLLADTEELMETARTLSSADLAQLMGLSGALAELNYDRFQSFAVGRDKPAESRAAAFAFRGDTYVGLQVDDFDADDLRFAQEHLRILSGLYGILRPLDRMQPYRLEMGTRVNTGRGDNLYDFWGERIARAINKQSKKTSAKAIVNLASNEYFTAARGSLLKARLITPVFKELRGGKAKIISFSAKRARGMMARYMVKKRLTNPDELRNFDEAGYRFNAKLSNDNTWVFLRKPPAGAVTGKP